MNSIAWCTYCGKRFTQEEVNENGKVGKCTACNSPGVPCWTENDVTIEINWHELHLLCVWAENWQTQCNDIKERTVTAIAHRIQLQHPEKYKLTLSEEIHSLLSDPFINVIESNIAKPALIPFYGKGAIGFSKKA